MMTRVTVIGGGFAGSEAAWAAANAGVPVRLYEMRPVRQTPVHQTPYLAEPVCSNSFKSNLLTTPAGLLKWEMRQFGSVVLACAEEVSVPAGEALAVDRHLFAQAVTKRLEAHPLIEIVREEVTDIPPDRPLIIATGPLTSDALAQAMSQLTGSQRLYFYDAVAPIVDALTLNMERPFVASRYGKGEAAYLNCPMTREEYDAFVDALLSAETIAPHDFEEPRYFEGCLPIEEIAARGRDALRFSRFKPVGLVDPRTGKRPYAVVQLRQENLQGTLYGLVGCQTRMKWGEQKRVFRLIPGLENAEFVRYGVMHRNTYIHSPSLLEPTLQLRSEPGILFAGQITGVEGYIESAMCGIVAGLNAARLIQGEEPIVLPTDTMMGALLDYISHYQGKDFQPMNANFGLLPEPEPPVRDRAARIAAKVERAQRSLTEFLDALHQ
ncbi:MAG: methylenetetrahydrofolate--tRNA-(uracil(54)-C(5))-methyltransferase (FADH(2)-oxidizing) TrmFO [Armatimonadota bacterium]|nr:methylenetetrahydrofolate--tRNA-(uracil(54)-C(5))-methyltransferase (FADH(2)-oxidizing) TrmFO [Armatimonadota bacterium]MDW8290935.1 methylenetetrahydrofolate--tRNA-(uracil(54)-C(5))-methyltransferase (FADH(2)-oxidizing) TrmFO [Armatimonadota bacterium]